MPDYKKGMIYKIVNNENSKVYYGSTCQPLYKRMYDHRQKHNKCMSKNLSVDLKDCQIILVEKIECECKYELLKRERFYIENNDCVNTNIPTRTKQEYYQANKDKINEYSKQYKQKNKQFILKQKKQHYEKNKDKILEKFKVYREKNKQKIAERSKQYKQNNKQLILKLKKQYYQKNKLKIEEKAKEKITCICGSVIRKDSKLRHFKSKKHISFINSNSSSSC